MSKLQIVHLFSRKEFLPGNGGRFISLASGFLWTEATFPASWSEGAPACLSGLGLVLKLLWPGGPFHAPPPSYPLSSPGP